MNADIGIRYIKAIGGTHKCRHCRENLEANDEFADIDSANGWFEHFDALKAIICYQHYQVELRTRKSGGMREIALWRTINGFPTSVLWSLRVHESHIAQEPYVVYEES